MCDMKCDSEDVFLASKLVGSVQCMLNFVTGLLQVLQGHCPPVVQRGAKKFPAV